MTPRKQPAAVTEAAKRASIPKRPVIQHTKLFRAELECALSKANDALCEADSALTFAASQRDQEREAADRAYKMACALADEKFTAIREQLDAERADITKTMDGVEAAIKAIDAPVSSPSNVVPMAAE